MIQGTEDWPARLSPVPLLPPEHLEHLDCLEHLEHLEYLDCLEYLERLEELQFLEKVVPLQSQNE